MPINNPVIIIYDGIYEPNYKFLIYEVGGTWYLKTIK